MIFNNTNETFESEKERNFYYKVFAGFLFNEFIPDYELRVKTFLDFLSSPVLEGKNANIGLSQLTDFSDMHISFDNHLYLFKDIETDRGEFADILIHSKKAKTLIAIEAKLHSGWSFSKDIEVNQKRLLKIKEHIPDIKIYPFLLIKESNWIGVSNKSSQYGSNITKIKNYKQNLTSIVMWEDLMRAIKPLNQKVHEYMSEQLKRQAKSNKYSFNEDWFF